MGASDGLLRLARARTSLACVIACVTACVIASDLPAARAAEADDERARTLATDLFDQGVGKMERGKCEARPVADAGLCAEACDAFRRAFELYPAGLGALRNLAYVEKALGRVASAARHFRELARRAPLDPRPARQLWAEYARVEISTLEPLVPHLTVRLPTPPPAGVVATLDDAGVPREAWGAALDVDPGAHVLRAQAPGHVAFELRFALAERESRTIVVALAPGDGSSTSATSASSASSGPPLPAGPHADASSGIPPRTLALVTIGVGVITTGVGLGYGVAAISKRKDACGDVYCDPVGYDEGRSLARRSTIVTGVGLAVVTGGVVWHLLAPSSSTRATTVVPYAGFDGAGVVVVRRF
jgi:hypothetical protein